MLFYINKLDDTSLDKPKLSRQIQCDIYIYMYVSDYVVTCLNSFRFSVNIYFLLKKNSAEARYNVNDILDEIFLCFFPVFFKLINVFFPSIKYNSYVN